MIEFLAETLFMQYSAQQLLYLFLVTNRFGEAEYMPEE